MASERAKADEENLRQTAFEKGEWANQPPTDLDVDYDLLSGALGTAGAPLMSITAAETLLAGQAGDYHDEVTSDEAVSYTHLPSPRDGLLSRMPSSA